MNLPLPDQPIPKPSLILIHAASTASGLYGVHFAQIPGLTVLATASPHNFEYIKSLGADEVFDYSNATCATDINSYTSNNLRFAWDCMGTGAEICGAASSDNKPNVYGVLDPVDKAVVQSINPHIDGPHFTLA